ncbi:MAG: ABC transporter permease [Roseovarius sp.]|nr:ABC transporter permease [Roseovarius sp.]MCY4316959.1 ABC transporter permease [Roseovarius sp.]
MSGSFFTLSRFALVFAAWLFGWWAITWVLNVNPTFLPPPTTVFERLATMATVSMGDGTLIVHILGSLKRFATGFALAVIIGIPLGFAMGYFKPINKLVTPIFEAIRPIPPIAWAPFAILWFGLNVGAQAFVILLAAMPPIIINAQLAIRMTDGRLIDAARVFGAGPLRVLAEVALPSSIPLVFTGLRIGVANGWMALIAAELVAGDGSSTGLGYLILQGQRTLNADLSIAAMIVIGVIGALLDVSLNRLNRYFQGWTAQT